MDMLGKVRRMRMRDSISISAIAKRTGLARNTIKKWLKAPGSVVPKYLRTKDLRKISSFEPVLLQALKADQLRHKDSRRTARALFVQITAQGYRGGYSGVTDFVRAWREQGGNQSVIHLRVLELESSQITMHRKFGGVHLVVDRTDHPIGVFRVQQMLDQPTGGFDIGQRPLAHHLLPGPNHSIQAQCLEFGGEITHGSPPHANGRSARYRQQALH